MTQHEFGRGRGKVGGKVVAIAGSSGLIGSALVSALRAADHRVLRIVRRAPSNGDELHWNPDSGEFDPAGLDGVDVVVNLCGVNVADKRWSGAFKQSLRDSRIDPTEVISAAVLDAGVPALINASAVGYYGDTRCVVVDETAPPGKGFLARLCVESNADLVAHGACGDEQRRLTSEGGCRTAFEQVDSGVFAVDVVADLSRCHRSAHLSRGPCDCVGTEVDDGWQWLVPFMNIGQFSMVTLHCESSWSTTFPHKTRKG